MYMYIQTFILILNAHTVCIQTELSRQEQSMAESRKDREMVLSDYRKQADEKKEFAEKVERRVRC